MKHKPANKPTSQFDSVALLLQGGGALGAYQGGVFQALSEAGMEPDWLGGISIGAINAAIVAGNAREDRVTRLREFWETITMKEFFWMPPKLRKVLMYDNVEHQGINLMSALTAMFWGIPGFFTPRLSVPWLEPEDTFATTSFYDTTPLRKTIERLVDFDRINNDNVRLTLGAVNVTTGNFTSFDNEEQNIGPEHVMASGALPPGLPAVEIDDTWYWDGGLVSNTPLQWLLEPRLSKNTLVFQVDLWSADGELPQNMAEVFTRQKDIQYSSRTRANTDRFRDNYQACHAIAALLDKLPKNLRTLPEAKELADFAHTKVSNIVHLIYHNKSYEGYSKDFEFSRLSMEAHWKAGYENTLNALSHPEVLQLPKNKEGIAIYDFSRDKPPLARKAKAA